MQAFRNDGMDFYNEDSLDFDTQPQTQSTQQASQQAEPIDVHLWGYLQPCNSAISRVDFWEHQPSYRIGRHMANHVVFPGPKISNYHCEITWDGQRTRDSVVTVRDISSNGTFINGIKIGRDCTRILREGNEIAFGTSVPQAEVHQDYRFIYRHTAAGQPTTGLYAHYDLSHELGKGSFATVMKAVERSTGKWYAVKIIHEKGNRSAADQARFEKNVREIEIMMKLKHPNICELKEVFYEDNGINLVLELIEGGDLLEYILKRGGLGERDAIHITYQMCQALAYIHSQGVTHRDLKPENVLLTKDDPPMVKVADFGLAKAVNSETMLRTMCGTPSYLAPEVVTQRLGEGYTNRVDSWSVGVIVFSMLTNASPFIEDETQRDIRVRISERQVDWSTLTHCAVSPQAEDFIRRLLDPNPQTRLSLTDALRHPWLSTYIPVYTNNLQVYDSLSSLDPQDFSMLTSMPNFDPNASVTTNMNGLQLRSISSVSNDGVGGLRREPSRTAPLQRRAHLLSQAAENDTNLPEPSWEMIANVNAEGDGHTADDDDNDNDESEQAATPIATTPNTGYHTYGKGQKRLHAELSPALDEDHNMERGQELPSSVGRMTRARARAQQYQGQPDGIPSDEDSFEVPGLTRRAGPPNKLARRR